MNILALIFCSILLIGCNDIDHNRYKPATVNSKKKLPVCPVDSIEQNETMIRVYLDKCSQGGFELIPHLVYSFKSQDNLKVTVSVYTNSHVKKMLKRLGKFEGNNKQFIELYKSSKAYFSLQKEFKKYNLCIHHISVERLPKEHGFVRGIDQMWFVLTNCNIPDS